VVGVLVAVVAILVRAPPTSIACTFVCSHCAILSHVDAYVYMQAAGTCAMMKRKGIGPFKKRVDDGIERYEPLVRGGESVTMARGSE
jgi:hypothetical protein